MRHSKADGLKPRRIPIFAQGSTVSIKTNQHPLNGSVGIIKSVHPLQNNVFYTVELSPGRCIRVPERMLKSV